jgi:ATP adenylyltransferase
VSLERLWAGWRSEYVGSVGAEVPGGDDCVLCRVLADGGQVIRRDEAVAAVVNAFPYTSGHLMVLPVRHVGELEDLTAEEGAAVWAGITDAVRALKAAYRPDGLNVGVNLGRSAGAGIPGHFHVHVLPRWNGDTNFMTTVAEARVLPESLDTTVEKLRAAWPDALSST